MATDLTLATVKGRMARFELAVDKTNLKIKILLFFGVLFLFQSLYEFVISFVFGFTQMATKQNQETTDNTYRLKFSYKMTVYFHMIFPPNHDRDN